MATNVAIAALIATMIWLVGVVPLVLVHIPIMLLAASIGVWLFYVQHQFEDTAWDRDDVWRLHEAALHGSSHYDLPSVMRWFTANIGVHHIHHLCSRIPYYRLPLVLRDYPELSVFGRLTLIQSFRCVRLVLWDEGQQRLVSFHEVRQRYALVRGEGRLPRCIHCLASVKGNHVAGQGPPEVTGASAGGGEIKL
jgi:omega-6 fatty acid desaturase (delta-12 desaturase)